MVNLNKSFLKEGDKIAFLHKMYFYLLPNAKLRSKYLKKHKILAGIGNHVHWQPRFFPTDPYCLILHDNIAIAANVTFLGHDIINFIYNNMQEEKIWGHKGCIEVMDNVFIGANVTICPNVKIGPNAIIGAGSVIVKDVLPGTVVGGNPAKIIGSFNDLMKERFKENITLKDLTKEERILYSWEKFKGKD